MTTAVEAIYEDGMLRRLQPLSLPEHTHVRLSVETLPDDPDRSAWGGAIGAPLARVLG